MGLVEERIDELSVRTIEGVNSIADDDVLMVAQKILNAKITLLFGNGGSHALASHMAADITKVSKGECLAVCPTDNVAGLTARSNDESYTESIMSLVIPYCSAAEEDVCVIGISTSGASPNVLECLAIIPHPILLTNNHTAGEFGDVICIPEPDVRIAENLNLIFMHMVVDYIERACK